MREIDLEKIQSIYFVGIGGIAMSATAGIAQEAGYQVFGSNSKDIYSPAKDVLDSYEIEYNLGYKAENIIASNADIFILSAGEDQNNPEVQYILENNLDYFSFSQLLYALFIETLRIVVTGTHGKSTTAGLLGYLLKNIDNSSFMVGGVLQGTTTNFHYGDGHYVVFEGDEYKATFDDPTPKFQYYKPDILLLNNIEFDHPDMFENLDQITEEFKELVTQLPDDGLIIYNADNVTCEAVVFESNIAKFSFSIDSPSHFTAHDIVYGPTYTSFVVSDTINPERNQIENYKISLPGAINVYNALGAIATLRALGFKAELIQEFLLNYSGIKRRFEILGKHNGVTIIDDYAHHPTAVRETLAASRLRYPDKKIWAIFEPHTYSRTQATLSELATCFRDADEVLLAEIYPAREQKTSVTITSKEVITKIKEHHKNVRLVPNVVDALNLLRAELSFGDVVVVMAVGDFNQLGYNLLNQ